jgi:hypothetical protein
MSAARMAFLPIRIYLRAYEPNRIATRHALEGSFGRRRSNKSCAEHGRNLRQPNACGHAATPKIQSIPIIECAGFP